MGDEAGRDALYKFGVFRLDAKTQILTKEGTKVDLDAKPIQVLLALLESAGVLVSRKDLLKKVWGGTSVSRDSIYQHISVLRKVLGESRNDNKYIMTVPRGGYQFLAPVEIITPIEQGKGDLSNEETEVFTVEADEDYVNAYETVEGGTATSPMLMRSSKAGPWTSSIPIRPPKARTRASSIPVRPQKLTRTCIERDRQRNGPRRRGNSRLRLPTV